MARNLVTKKVVNAPNISKITRSAMVDTGKTVTKVTLPKASTTTVATAESPKKN
jgi:hypothetical protein